MTPVARSPTSDRRTNPTATRKGRSTSDAADRALASTVRSTFGPNGLDKMLIDSGGSVLVTNTGASVLDKLDITDPIGRVLQAGAANQYRRASDGTTTTVLLMSALLREAENLVRRGLHPTTVLAGYMRAGDRARDRLSDLRTPVTADDEAALRRVVETTITGRWNSAAAARFGDLTVSALRAVEFDSRGLTLHSYPGGILRESEVLDGILVDLEASSTAVETLASAIGSIENPVIGLIDAELSIAETDSRATLTVETPDDIKRAREREDEARAEIVRTVRDLGVDVILCQQSVDGTIRTGLAKAGIHAVERTRRDEFDAIARATGAIAVLTTENLASNRLGRAGRIELRTIGSTPVLVVHTLPGEAQRSLVLRGGTSHVVEETKRIVSEAVDVVRLALAGGVVPGGGAGTMALARAVRRNGAGEAPGVVRGRERLAVEAYADALEVIPRTLATNAGRNAIDVITTLRSRHHAEESAIGIDASGKCHDMSEAGVLEPAAVLDRCLTTALETTATVLRIDEVLPASKSNGKGADKSRNNASHGRDRSSYPWAIGH